MYKSKVTSKWNPRLVNYSAWLVRVFIIYERLIIVPYSLFYVHAGTTM